MINPFEYGKHVTGENFCNRKKEIKELTIAAKSSQNMMLFSQYHPARFAIRLPSP